MRGFDPDEPDAHGDADATFRHLDDDIVEVRSETALGLLDRVTADLSGGGERREGQRDMVTAVAAALSRRRHLLIEAGTGVGKSLGYLVPVALAGTRVVVSTATKNLQDQLALKDAPLVAAHRPGMVVNVLKGRNNYLCRLRAAEVSGGGQLSFEEGEELPSSLTGQARQVLEWSTETATGDRDELSFEVDPRVWRTLSVTPQECLGRSQCPHGEQCFTERARDRAAESDVVIVNTHLYAAHLSAGATILPDHDIVVFDEAHEALDIFARVLGTSLNAGRFRSVAGLVRSALGADVSEDLVRLLEFADRFDAALRRQLESGATSGIGEELAVHLEEGSRLVAVVVDRLKEHRSDSVADVRRQRAQGPAVHLANDLARLRSLGPDELAWLSEREREIDLELSLVDVGPRLRRELFGTVTAILTSATIPETLGHDIGLEGLSEELRVPSPFDYPRHALLYVPEHLPTRTHEGAESAIADELVDLITAAGGRTLALFTNRSVMKRVADSVRTRVTTTVLIQDTLSRRRLIERFRDEADASLFAVTSYWQGVDVPGHSLSLVTIDRLPFARPDDPLSVARRERAGERAFALVDLPRAGMLLAQGVGRLIRSSDDRGVVAVLDTRLATASYRGRLLGRLPPMRRTRTKDEVLEFLRGIDAEHQ